MTKKSMKYLDKAKYKWLLRHYYRHDRAVLFVHVFVICARVVHVKQPRDVP